MDSVDNLPLAEKLDHAAGEGRRLPVLIEVRLDPAPKKSGCEPDDLPRLAEGVLLMPHLELRGLMTVPPVFSNLQEVRPIFRRLRELRDEMARLLDWPLPELSMGMSHDFGIAIEEGATQIRLGTALFGAAPRGRLTCRRKLQPYSANCVRRPWMAGCFTIFIIATPSPPAFSVSSREAWRPGAGFI